MNMPDVLTKEQVKQLLAQVTAKDVFLGVSKQLLELLRVQGGGPRFSKLGRLVRYRRECLDQWLIQHERVNTAERVNVVSCEFHHKSRG